MFSRRCTSVVFEMGGIEALASSQLFLRYFIFFINAKVAQNNVFVAHGLGNKIQGYFVPLIAKNTSRLHQTIKKKVSCRFYSF